MDKAATLTEAAETIWPPAPVQRDHSPKYQDILEGELDVRAALDQPVSRADLVKRLCADAGLGREEARAFVRAYCDRNGLLTWTPWQSAQVAIAGAGLGLCGVALGWDTCLIASAGHAPSRAAARVLMQEVGRSITVILLVMTVSVAALVVVSLLERAVSRRRRPGPAQT